jgi:hypothetical protein
LRLLLLHLWLPSDSLGYSMIALFGFGVCANLVLLKLAGDWGIPGSVFLLPLLLCLLGMAVAGRVGHVADSRGPHSDYTTRSAISNLETCESGKEIRDRDAK